MSKKWELLDERFHKAIMKAIEKKGELSLASIIESQYFFPRKYNIKPAIVKYKNKP
ncbi:hypothetical protein ACPV3S_20305 [Photobacterium damselae]|uniref:hypothetical protein n=1 Tax=Photobacterium damselae TaxID=38293 RepID=UPI0040680FE6